MRAQPDDRTDVLVGEIAQLHVVEGGDALVVEEPEEHGGEGRGADAAAAQQRDAASLGQHEVRVAEAD